MMMHVENLAVEKVRKFEKEADIKLRNGYKRRFFEAAKEARK